MTPALVTAPELAMLDLALWLAIAAIVLGVFAVVLALVALVARR